jgi:DNA mismatch repair ATPase MutS
MVNLVQLRKLLRQLILVLGFKAEIYENISEKWERIFGSPGNLASIEKYIFSGDSNESVSSCKIMSLKSSSASGSGSTSGTGTGSNPVFTVAVVDVENGTAQYCQFTDDVRCSQLESILVQIQVREIITHPMP